MTGDHFMAPLCRLDVFLLFTFLNIISNSRKKGNDIIVPYHDAKGKLRYRVFYNEGFKRKLPSSFADVDNIPYIITVPQPTLVERLKSKVCELCGKVGPVVMHHARNLNHLKGDTEWEKLMLAKHRKTLVVCTSCNAKIQSHAG